jgi:type VI protein secretion system component Hcp
MSTRYFFALNGVKGDSLNSTYKGWFEVNNFDIDLTGAGGGAGTAFSPLTLTLGSNTGLAPLLELAATGNHLNGATLVGVTEGAGQAKVYQLDLADVLVTNVEHHADPITEGGPTLTLDYSKIELETFTQDGAGGVVPEGQFGFDLTANTAGITVPSADPGGSVAASPQPLIDYFMLIDGLNGGSFDPQHEGWFEIRGVDLDMEKLTARDFASLNVTVPAGVELADVMRMATVGHIINGVHIEGFTAGRNATKVYDLTLEDVMVAHVGVSNAAGSESLDYSLSLDYGKIALVTNGIDASGKLVKNGEFAYDVTNHTEIAPFSLGLTPGTNSSFASGSRYFLKLDGVPGELSLNGEKFFEVNSFGFDIEGGGRDAGKPIFSPLTLTLDSNTALAPLLTIAATGGHLDGATLVGVRADGDPISFQLDLGLVFATKVEDIAGAGLTVSLEFGQIRLQPFNQDKNGVFSLGPPVFWDVVMNSNVDEPGTFPDTPGSPPEPVSITGMPSSPEPATYFMLIDGLNGGSTDASHKGWFEISSLDFDLANPADIGAGSGGAGTGKPNFSLLNVTLPNEAGLADAMDLAATGGLVKGVRIEGFTGGTTPAEVYDLTLADVAVTKVADGEGDGYSLSLDYGKVALVTTGIDAFGRPTTSEFSYDIVHNVTNVNPDPSSLVLNPGSSGGPVTPAKYFLALDGIKGDSLDSNHKGWFEVGNFNIDLDNVFAGAPGGPGGPGKPDFSPLTLTLDSNTGLAPVLELVATGNHLNGATLVGVTAGEQDKVYQLDLADVLVTKVEDDAAAGLTLSLDYGKIELDTFAQNAAGLVVPEGQFGFDLTANTAGITVPSADPGGSIASSPQPASYFMLIDGVNGGSTDQQHKGWFEITGFDLDLEKLVAGGTNFSPLIVTPENEAGLADVMDLAATGGLVKGVRIEGITAGAAPAEVYDLTLADVQVTKVADGEGDGYSLSLDYGKIALVTNGIDATGKPSQNGEFGYDVANNIEIAPFTLALNPGHAPVANALSISTDEDTAVAVTLSGSDVDGDSLTFAVVSGPAHGTLSGTGANLAYTPAPDYNGPDAFTYAANDGAVDSAAASVSLTVNAVNDAPVYTSPATFAVAENNTTVGTVTATDPEGDPVMFAKGGGADQALFAIDPTGALRFIAPPDFETPRDADGDNVYELVVSATDGLGALRTQTLAIEVTDQRTEHLVGSPRFELAAFTPGTGGWISDDLYKRELADVNGDQMADIVGFASSGVVVSLATGNGHFAAPTFELAAFTPGTGGWISDDLYKRELADVNGDGMEDIVGFASAGVFVSRATGSGHFAAPTFELAAFTPGTGGWISDDLYKRELADVNGDGMEDIVGFASAGVYVSRATGNGHFAAPTFELAAFTPGTGGWISDDLYRRELADVNGDERADIVGFASNGVYVSQADDFLMI